MCLYFFQIFYSLVPKIEICLKYFLDKKFQKQPLCTRAALHTDGRRNSAGFSPPLPIYILIFEGQVTQNSLSHYLKKSVVICYHGRFLHRWRNCWNCHRMLNWHTFSDIFDPVCFANVDEGTYQRK